MIEILATCVVVLGQVCGDGTVDPGENCSTCPADVQCETCEDCFNGSCVPSPLCTCGDGTPDPDETCASCPGDVPCKPGQSCVDGVCASQCKSGSVPIDLVFVLDTSGSMADEIFVLCDTIVAVEGGLEAQGIDVTVTLLGITPSGFPCLSQSVNELFNTTLGTEDWGPATAVLAAAFPWTTTARIIVPVGDEGPQDGDPCNDPGDDRDSIEDAIVRATENGVIVSPIAGTGSPPCVVTLAMDLAAGTGGTFFESTDPKLDLVGAIFDLVEATVCLCPADFDGDGTVGINDFLVLLSAWDTAAADLDGDGDTSISDLLLLLAAWGDCVA